MALTVDWPEIGIATYQTKHSATWKAVTFGWAVFGWPILIGMFIFR